MLNLREVLFLVYKSVHCVNYTLLIKVLFYIPVLLIRDEHLFLGQSTNIVDIMKPEKICIILKF